MISPVDDTGEASGPIAIPSPDMPGVRRTRPTDRLGYTYEHYFYETGTPLTFSAGMVCCHEGPCQACADSAFASLVGLVEEHNTGMRAR